MEWEREDVNYWENENCPDDYLRTALSNLIYFVEGARVPATRFTVLTREQIVKEISFYEDAADK